MFVTLGGGKSSSLHTVNFLLDDKSTADNGVTLHIHYLKDNRNFFIFVKMSKLRTLGMVSSCYEMRYDFQNEERQAVGMTATTTQVSTEDLSMVSLL